MVCGLEFLNAAAAFFLCGFRPCCQLCCLLGIGIACKMGLPHGHELAGLGVAHHKAAHAQAIHFGVHVDAGLFGQTLRHILFFKIGGVAIFLRHSVLGFGGFGRRLSVAGRASREQEGAE